jgi:hypothetical protein
MSVGIASPRLSALLFLFAGFLDSPAFGRSHHTISEDMESAFSAGAAEGLKTQFLAIRIISDSEFHAPKLEEVAGEHCAAFVVDLIRRVNYSI